MNIFGQDFRFWIAVFFAIVIKLATSESHSFQKVFVTVSASLLIAWAGTDVVIEYLGLDPDKHLALIGAVLALTGESIVRWLINLNPTNLIKAWRGK